MNEIQRFTIITKSGREVNLLNPQYLFIDIRDIAHGLAYQCRFNGQTSSYYSVAQHSIMVASLLPSHLQLEGLLHDATEAYLGDIVQPLKVLLPKYQEIEANFAYAIGQRFRVNLEENEQVKHADLVALATEKRDLFPKSCADFEVLKNINPHPKKLVPMTPDQSEQSFLRAYDALQKSRSQNARIIFDQSVLSKIAA